MITSSKVTMAVENKSVTTKNVGDVDKLIFEAIEQLTRRKDYTTLRAEVDVSDEDNTWPFTPTETSRLTRKPNPFECKEYAEKRYARSKSRLKPVLPPSFSAQVVVESARWGRFQFAVYT